MKALADKSPDNQRQAADHEAPQQHASAEADYEFVDNCAETASLRQLQEVAENSPRASGLAQLKVMMNNSFRNAAMQSLQVMVNNSSRQAAQRQQHSRIQGASMGLQAESGDVLVQRVEDEELLQGKFVAESLAHLAQQPNAKTNNTGLPDNLKAGVESFSGLSLDNVKVHYNSSQPVQLNAYAYAQGTDIHVGPEQKQHLPHEAWHVVQQAQGKVKPTMKIRNGIGVNDEQELEAEADVLGARAISSGMVQEQESGGSIESDTIGSQQIIQAKLVKLEDGFYALDEEEESIVNDGNVKYRLITHDDQGNYLLEDNWGEQVWYDFANNVRGERGGPMAQGGVGFAPIRSYRAQGGVGHESVGIIKHGEDNSIDLNEMEKQLNLAVGDVLHSRYFAQVKRSGNANIVSLLIDRYFFVEWVVEGSIAQRGANTNEQRLFIPPNDELIPFIDKAVKSFLNDQKGGKIDVTGVLGNWAEGVTTESGIKPIPAVRIGDFKQPSYKVEMEPPWPFLLNLFSEVREAPKPAQDFEDQIYDPAEVKDPNLLAEQITKLKKIAKSSLPKRPKKPKSKNKAALKEFKKINEKFKLADSKIRRLEKLCTQMEVEQSNPSKHDNKYDTGLFNIYNDFGRLKRELLPPQQWFSLIL